ncbi:MAG: ABC transporter ATP-binding protein [Pirellulales bacterium]
MFRLEKVSKCYAHKGSEVVALRPTALEIASGEFVGVIGPSGSGKSTLLSMLGGMMAPTSGQVWLDGHSLYDATATQRAQIRRQKIGFVFQMFNLIPYLSALENVQIPLMLSGPSSSDEQQRAIELLERVGLEGRVHHKPSELSIGQQQRVALARTLANDPTVILADEPTGNLDPQTRRQVLEFLEELCHEGRTVVMVTHDPIAAQCATRTIKLEDGAVIFDSMRAVQQVA